MSESNLVTCIVCGSTSHKIICTEIREGQYNVLQCNDCHFIFLQDYQTIDYTSNYGSYLSSKTWSEEDKVIKRSESLKRFNNVVAELINDKNYCKVLEIGAGNGSSIYGLDKLIGFKEIDCVELNTDDQSYLEKEFNVKVYSAISDLKKNYDVVYGHHVFEHFLNPLDVLDEIDRVSSEDCKLYFSLPNFNDYYSHVLNSEQRDKYHTFNYHMAHPYYLSLIHI